MKISRLLVILGIATLLPLASCGKARPPLPQGEQTVSGILRQAALSATRRGTHLLEVNGKNLSFVESSVVRLSQYEGMQVTIKGVFEENSDPDILPVLIASEVTTRTIAYVQWKSPKTGIVLTIPQDWVSIEDPSGTQFTASGSFKPILTVSPSPLKALPAGTPTIVAGEKAVRLLEGGTGSQILYVSHAKAVLTITFSPFGTEQQRLEQGKAFQRIVQSASFGAKQASGSGSSLPSGTGSALGQPCGGEAGILCPAGQYCAITDFSTNIGRCKVVK